MKRNAGLEPVKKKRPMTAKVNAPEDFLRLPYARVVIPEESGGFFAEVLEFPGCFAEGDTASEALESLERVAAAWVFAALSQGQEIPQPTEALSFTGKYPLRIPRGLHRQAAKMALREGTSLNQYFATAIAARVGAEDLYYRLAEKLDRPRKFLVQALNVYPVTPVPMAEPTPLQVGAMRTAESLGGMAFIGGAEFALAETR